MNLHELKQENFMTPHKAAPSPKSISADSHPTKGSSLPFLPYVQPSISPEDIAAVSLALSTPQITRGTHVAAFEQAVADYCHVPYAVAFSSGTAALQAAYFAAETNSFDKLLTSPNTFVATAGAGMLFGATPVFMDIDRQTGNMDLDQLEATLAQPASQGRTIITPVHFAGIAVDMQRLESFIACPDTIVIEDAAHALGSCYADGQKVGCCAWSQMTMFSFHPNKHITTGEGGMVTTQDPALWHRLQLFRDNGIERHPEYMQQAPASGYYEVHALTGNYNFTEMQAALGLSQLKRLDAFVEKKRLLVKRYRKHLSGLPHINLWAQEHDPFTAYHLCVVQIDFAAIKSTRAKVMAALQQQGIGSQVHYIPLYRHPFFQKKMGDLTPYFPQTESYYAQALSLPLYYDLTEQEVDRICAALKKIMG